MHKVNNPRPTPDIALEVREQFGAASLEELLREVMRLRMRLMQVCDESASYRATRNAAASALEKVAGQVGATGGDNG